MTPAIGLLLATASRLGGFRAWWLIPLMLLRLVLAMLALVCHADAIELERHAHMLGLQLRVADWMLVVGLAEAIPSPPLLAST